MRKKVLIVFGTRPEAIKMAPLVYEFQKNSDKFETKVCVTAQHRQMLDQVLDFFNIKPDFDLNLMKDNQTLSDITVNVLKGLDGVLSDYKPNLIFVQGDTSTTFVSALAGFYNRTKVAHLEAGLRSFNKYSPFPEEINRILAGHLSDFHFAPTEKAYNNLINEGIKENVFNVGNTVIDALFLGIEIIKKQGDAKFLNYFNNVDFGKRIMLVTGHRRESFGEPFQNICLALKNIAQNYDNLEIIYPVHLNPNVQKPVYSLLDGIQNIHLIEPLDYPFLIWLMDKSYLVLTDSGGIQEEAPSLGKPVLVMREVTERTEGIEAGTAKLVGTDTEKIISETRKLLDDEEEYTKMSKSVNPYGDGKTSERILKILGEIF